MNSFIVMTAGRGGWMIPTRIRRLMLWYADTPEDREKFGAFVRYSWTRQQDPQPLQPNVWGAELDWDTTRLDEWLGDHKPPVPGFGAFILLPGIRVQLIPFSFSLLAHQGFSGSRLPPFTTTHS